MDVQAIRGSLDSFIRKHKASFEAVNLSESQALEVGSLVLAVEHYRRQGYGVSLQNLKNEYFKLKLSAKGHPRTFSWYEVSKDGKSFEIHGNLAVQSAYRKDRGLYVVDVGVVEGGNTPARKVKVSEWGGYQNKILTTFIESKKLVIYPMLLAQFVGIVHEIMPSYLRKHKRNETSEHFFPALVSIGYLKGTSKNIVSAYDNRGFRLNIIPVFDEWVSKMAVDNSVPSPLRCEVVAAEIVNQQLGLISG